MKDWVDKRLKEIKLPDKIILFPVRDEDIARRQKSKKSMHYDRFCGQDDKKIYYLQYRETSEE